MGGIRNPPAGFNQGKNFNCDSKAFYPFGYRRASPQGVELVIVISMIWGGFFVFRVDSYPLWRKPSSEVC